MDSLKLLERLLASPEPQKMAAAYLAFVQRTRGSEKRSPTDAELAAIAKTLQLADNKLAAQAVDAAWELIRSVVRGRRETAESVGEVLGGVQLSAQSRGVLCSVCAALCPQWTAEALRASQLSLPRLQQLKWRLDVQTASSNVSGAGRPAVLVQLLLEGDKTVTFEMDPQTLAALLSGLDKIKAQLSKV